MYLHVLGHCSFDSSIDLLRPFAQRGLNLSRPQPTRGSLGGRDMPGGRTWEAGWAGRELGGACSLGLGGKASKASRGKFSSGKW